MLLNFKKIPKSYSRSNLASIRCFVSFKSKQVSHELNRILTECEGSIPRIKKTHAKIITGGYEQNVYIGSKLINMYAGLGQVHMNHARQVFDKMPDRDVFLWNMMIQTYANSGLCNESLSVYKEMCENNVVADKYTFTFAIKACSVAKDETSGRVVHGRVVKTGFGFDVFVGNALVGFYGKCLMMEECKRVFDEILEKDVVSWNTVISGLANNGFSIEAIDCFHTMIQNEFSIKPDQASIVSVLPACAKVGEIRLGFWVHCYGVKTGLTHDAKVGSGLISVYANCGHLEYARQVFDEMPERNVMVWTAMMRGYGMHGDPHEALGMFSKFLESGFRPDGVVFLCLLSTCSHAGLVSKGGEIFNKMEDYGVERCDEHYACMVDLYGRAGLVKEAVEFVKSMPVLPGKDVYGALLGACRMHNNNVELAEVVAEKLFVLDPNGGGRYVTLAKIYGDGGRLKDAAAVRKVMVKKKIKKQFGFSSIKVDSVVHTFGVEDENHIRRLEIFETLVGLDEVMGFEFDYQIEAHC